MLGFYDPIRCFKDCLKACSAIVLFWCLQQMDFMSLVFGSRVVHIPDSRINALIGLSFLINNTLLSSHGWRLDGCFVGFFLYVTEYMSHKLYALRGLCKMLRLCAGHHFRGKMLNLIHGH